MQIKNQIQVAARIEGCYEDVPWVSGGLYVGYEYGKGYLVLPDYLNDHNAIQRLVDRMKSEDEPNECKSAYKTYCEIMFSLEENDAFTATCPQKLEAILRAYNVWEEE